MCGSGSSLETQARCGGRGTGHGGPASRPGVLLGSLSSRLVSAYRRYLGKQAPPSYGGRAAPAVVVSWKCFRRPWGRRGHGAEFLLPLRSGSVTIRSARTACPPRGGPIAREVRDEQTRNDRTDP